MTKIVTTNTEKVLNVLKASTKKLCVATIAKKAGLTSSQVYPVMTALMNKGGIKISRKELKVKSSTKPVYCYWLG